MQKILRTVALAVLFAGAWGEMRAQDCERIFRTLSTSGAEEVLALAADGAGNVFATGYFRSTLDFGGQSLTADAGTRDVFLAKYTSEGQLLWVRQAGGPGNEEGRGLAVDPDGNVYLTGFFSGSINVAGAFLTGAGGSDVFLAKFSSSGQRLWAVRTGGTLNERAHALVYTPGAVTVVGYFSGTGANIAGNTLSSAGEEDVFVARFNSETGAGIWSRSAGGSDIDYAYGVCADPDGNVFVAGFFISNAVFGSVALSGAMDEVFVAKLSPSGDWLWTVKGGGNSADNAFAVAYLDGAVYTTGYFGETASFGAHAAVSRGILDAFVAKTDAQTGQWLWVKNLGGTSGDEGVAVAPAGDGVWVVGSFRSTSGFVGDLAYSRGSADAYAAKISPEGELMGLTALGSTALDAGKAVTFSNGPVVALTYGAAASVGGQSVAALSAQDALMVRICPATVVWPGDADKNGTVNLTDCFLTASGYGAAGPARQLPSSQWAPQTADGYWSAHTNYKSFPLNFAHLDANGDGAVNLFDVALTVAHRGLTRP